MSITATIAAGATALTLLGAGGAAAVNAATPSTNTSPTTTATTATATIAKTKTAAGDYGGPKTGNGVGKGPTVDRSDMSSAQLAQVQKTKLMAHLNKQAAPQQILLLPNKENHSREFKRHALDSLFYF